MVSPVSVAVPQVKSVEDVKDLKKFLNLNYH